MQKKTNWLCRSHSKVITTRGFILPSRYFTQRHIKMMTLTRTRCQRSLIHLCNKSASFSNSSTNRTSDATTTAAISSEKKPSKKSKKKSISTLSPSSSPSKPKAPLKQVRTIKNLHKENKALFGVLLESKQDKVKRTKQELKLMKTLTPSSIATENKRISKKKGLVAAAVENESLAIAENENDEVAQTLDLILQDEKKRAKESEESGSSNLLPKASSVRVEHAGVSINKNRIKRDVVQDNMMGKSSPLITTPPRDHKEAEIEWAMKNAPTKIKLIELSTSSSSTSDEGGGTDQVGDTTQRQLVHGQGHNSTLWPLPNEKNEHKRAGVGAPASSSSSVNSYPHSRTCHQDGKKVEDHQYLSQSPESSSEEKVNSSLPTVEQLINSFYETDNGQLRPRSETRKMVLSATKSSSSSKHDHVGDDVHVVANHKYSPHYLNAQEENLGGGDGTTWDFNEHQHNNKTDDYDRAPNNQLENKEPEIGAQVSSSAIRDSTFLLPYYNPDRNVGETENCIKYDNDHRHHHHHDHNSPEKITAAESLKNTLTAIITSFPYPFPFSSSKRSNNAQAGTTQEGAPSNFSNEILNLPKNNGADNKMIMKSESQQLLPSSQSQSPLSSVKLPSVSKILNATMPKEQAEALRRWEQRMIAQMGEQGFRQYKESILTNGKSLHSSIECYLRGTPPEEISIAEPNQGHWNSLNAVLASIDHVHVLESHVIHPKLQYCGVIDCVAEFRNRLVLIDWKTSQKPKPFVSMTYDTPLQIAAYIGAINYDERYSMKIDDGLIVVAYEDGSSCQTFLLRSTDVEKYWKLWLKRLELFRKLNTPL